MIDATTHRPLHVSQEGDGGPYIMVPLAQLAEVEQLLKRANLPYWVDEYAISLDGEPEVAVINIGQGIDAKRVQAVLDNSH